MCWGFSSTYFMFTRYVHSFHDFLCVQVSFSQTYVFSLKDGLYDCNYDGKELLDFSQGQVNLTVCG
jgi:hypothetical protein